MIELTGGPEFFDDELPGNIFDKRKEDIRLAALKIELNDGTSLLCSWIGDWEYAQLRVGSPNMQASIRGIDAIKGYTAWYEETPQ